MISHHMQMNKYLQDKEKIKNLMMVKRQKEWEIGHKLQSEIGKIYNFKKLPIQIAILIHFKRNKMN